MVHSSVIVVTYVVRIVCVCVCRTEQIFPPENGTTYVSKHVGEVNLTFVLIMNVQLAGTINGVR
jgi:hypothetical protein